MRTETFVPGLHGIITMSRQIDIFYNDSTYATYAPSGSAFGSSSELVYTIELRDANTDTLIQVLDTAIVSLNGSGDYQYTTSGNTANMIAVATNAGATQSVYLDLNLVQVYPVSSPSIVTWYFPVLDLYQGGYYGQAQYVPGAGKLADGEASWLIPPQLVTSFSAYTDATSGVSYSSVISGGGFGATMNIYDVLGRNVASIPVQITDGTNTFILPLSKVPSGVYYVELLMGNTPMTAKLER